MSFPCMMSFLMSSERDSFPEGIALECTVSHPVGITYPRSGWLHLAHNHGRSFSVMFVMSTNMSTKKKNQSVCHPLVFWKTLGISLAVLLTELGVLKCSDDVPVRFHRSVHSILLNKWANRNKADFGDLPTACSGLPRRLWLADDQACMFTITTAPCCGLVFVWRKKVTHAETYFRFEGCSTSSEWALLPTVLFIICPYSHSRGHPPLKCLPVIFACYYVVVVLDLAISSNFFWLPAALQAYM